MLLPLLASEDAVEINDLFLWTKAQLAELMPVVPMVSDIDVELRLSP
jgi:hypothetical protein